MEDLYKNREPVPEMKAVYFMTPTAKVRAQETQIISIISLTLLWWSVCDPDVLYLQCVDAFINDFKPKPKYKAAYVFFTDCEFTDMIISKVEWIVLVLSNN